MKLNHRFTNLLGSVYTGGNVVFHENKLISPVGNRVSIFDLKNNKALTLDAENRKDIAQIAVSGSLLISVDVDGRALLINLARGCIIARHSFKAPVKNIKFSPSGKYFAVTHGNKCQLWLTPHFNREFAPFVLHRTYTGHYDAVVFISWSECSEYFITTSKDMSTRIYSVDPVPGFIPVVLSGHRETVVGAWFGDDMNTIYSISKDGALIEWIKEYSNLDDPAAISHANKKSKAAAAAAPKYKSEYIWKIRHKHFFLQNSKVVSASFHRKTRLASIGFASGVFGIWELPDFTCIHSLSISQKKISTVAVNETGEWLAFGCESLGQLLVWEWQSESYVIKQNGHHYDINALSYSSDSQFIATAAQDSKIKIWNVQSGFCFVTFTQHSASVTAAQFTNTNNVLFSASLDGTVRAFDLVRYRCFKTFTSPTPVQFSCLAVDPSGEVVCAGSLDTFEIYVWSVITGNLLDIYTGHEGPLSSMSFSPTGGKLITGSWDKTVRVWDVFSRDTNVEVFTHESEVLSIAFRPDAAQIAVSTLGGSITFWDVEQGSIAHIIEGKKDLSGGRLLASKTLAKDAHFNCVAYNADGSCIIAAGNSKYICIYDVASRNLLKRHEITKNRSFDGVDEQLNSKNMTEAGNMDLLDEEVEEYSDLEDRLIDSMPGQLQDQSLRKTRLAIRIMAVQFSHTGRSFACATTQGLAVYSLDDYMMFDPFDLEIDVTPDSVLELCKHSEWLKALVFSLRIGERDLQTHVFNSIPSDAGAIQLIIQDLPVKYLDRLCKFLCFYMNGTRLEFYLEWCTVMLKLHGRYMKANASVFQASLRNIRKILSSLYEDIGAVCDENTYTARFIIQACNLKREKAAMALLAQDGGDMMDIIKELNFQ